MPHLEKLFEKVNGRSDVAIVTFNMDDNPGMIEPLMKEKKLAFPVLPAKALVEEIDPDWSLPSTWIIDRAGNMRMRSRGFSGDGEKWIAGMLEALEKTK